MSSGWWPCGVPRPVYLWPAPPVDDCDCEHPRTDHPADGPCRVPGCGCAYYDAAENGPWW